MHKRDVLFVVKPQGFVLGLAIILVGSVIIWLAEPATRPGIFECLLAGAFGLASGLVASRSWIAQLRYASEIYASPVDWISILLKPRLKTGFPIVIQLSMMAGMGAVLVVLNLLAPTLTGFNYPWSHVSAQTAQEPPAGALCVCIITSLVPVTVAVRRWYSSLPD